MAKVGGPTPTQAAIAAYRAGRNAEAARLGLLALEKDPRNNDLRLKTANALAWTEQYPDALRLYGELLGTRLKNQGTLGIADIHLWNGRAEEAIPLYKSLLAVNPRQAQAKEGLAKAEALLAKNAPQPITGLPATVKALEAYAAGRNAEAGRLGLEALEKDADNHDLRLKTANALAWTEQYPEALRQYGALASTPLKDEGTLGIANINLWNGRAELATPLYTSLLEKNPNNADAKAGLEKAQALLRKNAASLNAPPATIKAIDAYLAGRNAEAAKLGLEALAQDADNHDLRLKTANALAWTEQYPEALRQYGALANTPLKDEGTLGIANINLWNGRGDLAAPLYMSLLASNPNRTDAKEGLAKARALASQQPAAATTAALPKTAAAIDAYLAGRNAAASRLGLEALQADPDNHDLRLKTANALAWTSQYPEALRQYGALLNTPLKDEGTLGLANVNLWSGRAHVAAPLYASLLAINPANAEAAEGLEKAKELLRPRTTVRTSSLKDSDDSQRELVGVIHQWRSADLKRVYEVIVEGGRESRTNLVPELNPRDVGFTVEDFGLPFSPKLKIEVQDAPVRKTFAELGIKLAGDAINLDIGHVNWAKIAFNPLSRRDGLAADKIGLSGRYDSAYGHVSGNYINYRVTGGNVVQTGALQFTPSWQPLPSSSGVKLFTGLYGYTAQRADVRYWSPVNGYYTAFVGASFGRWEKEYELYAEIKRSFLIGGEGSGGASVNFGGKRKLNKDWALRGDAFLLDSGRSGENYRSRFFTVALDRYW